MRDAAQPVSPTADAVSDLLPSAPTGDDA